VKPTGTWAKARDGGTMRLERFAAARADPLRRGWRAAPPVGFSMSAGCIRRGTLDSVAFASFPPGASGGADRGVVLVVAG
jgi:hypothetical protein